MTLVEQQKTTTLEDFLEFIHRPENLENNYELINGEIIQAVSHPKSSNLAFRIGGFLFVYLSKNDIGRGLTADGGFVVGEERFMPDVSFISYDKQPDEFESDNGYVPVVPDFVVEIISPTDRIREVMIKVGAYLHAGVLVWLVYPEQKKVAVYEPDKIVVVYDENDTLTGGTVLPDFKLAVKDIFR